MNFWRNQTRNSYEYTVGLYKVIALDIDFDLGAHFKFKNATDYNQYTMNLIFCVEKSHVVVPLFKKSAAMTTPRIKTSSVMCSKCFFNLNSLKDYNDLKWWIYLNKKIGYEKIFFCNNSITYADFDKLFDKNKNFLDIQPLRCIPNFIAENNRDFFDTFNYFRYEMYFNEVSNTFLLNQKFFNLVSFFLNSFFGIK